MYHLTAKLVSQVICPLVLGGDLPLFRRGGRSYAWNLRLAPAVYDPEPQRANKDAWCSYLPFDTSTVLCKSAGSSMYYRANGSG